MYQELIGNNMVTIILTLYFSQFFLIKDNFKLKLAKYRFTERRGRQELLTKELLTNDSCQESCIPPLTL